MKKLKFSHLSASLMLLGVSSVFSTAQAQLMFSQYVDGNSNKKGIELYNPDPAPVNLADYKILQYTNGATEAKTTYTLVPQGTTSLLLNSQSRYLIGHTNLKNELGLAVNHVQNLVFNGDDALVLYYKDTPIDRFGKIGEQPANGWGVKKPSKANSFSRIETKNDVSSIDATQTFDLDKSWLAWGNRNDFQNLTNEATTSPEIVPVDCSTTTTAIADLRLAEHNKVYSIRGVITADYRYSNGFSGFYVQTPDSTAKKNLSNAIFVYIPNDSKVKGGMVGQEIVLKGRLSSFNHKLQLDQLDQNVHEIKTCNTNAQDWVKPVELNLPFDSLTETTAHAPQRYEGMLIKMPQTLTVSENYNYGRYGELSLSLGRLFIPTNLHPAQSVEAKELAKRNLLSKIILDDGYGSQNLTPWLPNSFNAKNTLRAGYQLANVQGILEYTHNAWRIQPIKGKTAPTIIETTNARQAVKSKQPDHVRVVAFNVLNYDNGAAGFPTQRGADTDIEFQRQHVKIVDALKKIDADVYGLMEIANNGYAENSALAYLTKSLGADWKYVIPEGKDQLGSDEIAVAIIYNAQRVKPVNQPAILDLGDKNRTTIAQSFMPISGGKVFTVVPNHLKSKGSCDPAQGKDQDLGDGQGCWNETRVQASEQLIQWLAKNPTKVETPNALILGDINVYAKEDPILTFERAGYKALLNDEKIGLGKQAYSYIFGVASNKEGYGGAGNLDHILADASVSAFVDRAFTWTINADEPTALDYNQEYKTEAQMNDFYANDAYRSSDHDPIIVDLNLMEQATEQPPLTDSNEKEDPKTEDASGGSANVLSGLLLFILAMYSYLVRRKTQ